MSLVEATPPSGPLPGPSLDGPASTTTSAGWLPTTAASFSGILSVVQSFACGRSMLATAASSLNCEPAPGRQPWSGQPLDLVGSGRSKRVDGFE
jgi:hypothetical protein